MANRTVKFYKTYFLEFLKKQSFQVRKKITQTLVWISTIDRLPVSIFRHIADVAGLFEIRIEYAGNIFRVFCCFDDGGFQKKTQKTPVKEIEKAKRLMAEYFEEKKDGNK